MKKIFYAGALAVLASMNMYAADSPREIPTDVQSLHENVWSRFVPANGLVLDYADSRGKVDMPTADDCLNGRPNAVSWWCPTENGAFFTGLYLEAMVKRATLTGAQADKDNARRLAAGLLSCGKVGQRPGFIARYVMPDGRSHYGMGSDDQTGPWFSGLWSYVTSGIPDESEKADIVAKMVEVGTALEANKWLLPCDTLGVIAPGEVRGGFGGDDFRSASRLLFINRILFELTKDDTWKQRYLDALTAIPPKGDIQRKDIISAGMERDFRLIPSLATQQLWIYVNPQSMLRELWRLEEDPALKKRFRDALAANAKVAKSIVLEAPTGAEWSGQPFNMNWRELGSIWRPQRTSGDATALATEQFKLWKNGGRYLEIKFRREPLCAAWICLLAPEDSDRPAVSAALRKLLAGTDWKAMASSFGIFAEGAWHQMQEPPIAASR